MLAAGPAHVEFRHELARHAIEEATPPHRRLALHKAALAALPDDAEPARARPPRRRRQRHGRGPAPRPPRRRRAAASGAHREAAAQYARALRYADDLPPTARAELLQRHADECYLAAEFEAAIAAQRAALDIRRQLGDTRGEGDALRSLSRLLFFAGRTAEAEPVVLKAVELLEPLPPSHELAMAYGNVAQRRMVVEDHAATVEWGTKALTLAETLDDTEAYLYALTNIGGAEFQRASRRAARSSRRRATSRSRTASRSTPAARICSSCCARSATAATTSPPRTSRPGSPTATSAGSTRGAPTC